MSVCFHWSRTCTPAWQARSQACCWRSTTQSCSTCWSPQSLSAQRSVLTQVIINNVRTLIILRIFLLKRRAECSLLLTLGDLLCLGGWGCGCTAGSSGQGSRPEDSDQFSWCPKCLGMTFQSCCNKERLVLSFHLEPLVNRKRHIFFFFFFFSPQECGTLRPASPMDKRISQWKKLKNTQNKVKRK